ncbi:MAG: hypothetical protein ABIU77_19390, partial [Ferruginibacter sp.]
PHKKYEPVDQAPKEPANENKKILITIGIALVLLITIWIWKSIEIKDIRSKTESDYQALKEQAIKGIVAAKEEQLKVLAKPYVWAVRTEMMKGNISQVNLYALDMIKENNFMRIAIANDSGIIVSSTNKKDEGNSFTSIGEAAALTNDNTLVANTGDSVLIVTSPIMGFNKRLGTLFIKYAVQLPALEQAK